MGGKFVLDADFLVAAMPPVDIIIEAAFLNVVGSTGDDSLVQQSQLQVHSIVYSLQSWWQALSTTGQV